jgi:antitoxin component YwqK of YwqJK toxin-antitoxin module
MDKIAIQAPRHPYFKTALWEDFDYRPEDSAELYEGQTFTGIAYDYDTKTGNLIKEQSYWDGGLHGFVKLWYPSGKIKLECRYFAGDFYGNLKEWYENGCLKRHGIYWGSYCPLIRKIWDEEGSLTEDYHIKNDERKLSYYTGRKKNVRQTLYLRRNWASTRHPGLIDFNKQIQLYLRENPFIGIEPRKQ